MDHSTRFLAVVEDAKSRVRETTVEEVLARRARGAAFELIDVREDREWNDGHASGARHLGREGSLGAIAPGMLADLVVLDQDPYAVAIRDVHRTRVRMTIIGGEVVYERRD